MRWRRLGGEGRGDSEGCVGQRQPAAPGLGRVHSPHGEVPALYPEGTGQGEREGITFVLREDYSGTCVENEWPAQKQKPP